MEVGLISQTMSMKLNKGLGFDSGIHEEHKHIKATHSRLEYNYMDNGVNPIK